MSKNEKGFYLFFDWIERLKELPPEEAIRIVYAIGEYYKNDIDPTEQFSGALKIVVALMFDQIKRGKKLSEIRATAGQKGGFAKAKESKTQISHDLPRQNVATYNNITDNSITNNNNNNNNDNIVCGSAQARERDTIEFEVIKFFNEHHFISSVEDFIAYNKARDWKGYGGEDICEDFERYAWKWEAEEHRRLGETDWKPPSDL